MTAAASILLVAAPVALGSTPAADKPADSAAEAAPAHPIITEVLFNVPRGDQGDANADGSRHAAADEFIELYNPTDAPINLRGYQIRSRLTLDDEKTTNGVRFDFPDFSLPARSTVVIFNGFDASIPGPTGSADAAPAETNPNFNNTHIFVIKPPSRTNAFSNTADFIALRSPGGEVIECIAWGEPDPAAPEDAAALHTVAANPGGSVARKETTAELAPHTDIDSTVCSPGVQHWSGPANPVR